MLRRVCVRVCACSAMLRRISGHLVPRAHKGEAGDVVGFRFLVAWAMSGAWASGGNESTQAVCDQDCGRHRCATSGPQARGSGEVAPRDQTLAARAREAE
eukprot:258246-Pyramimonas_sp.AAC.1